MCELVWEAVEQSWLIRGFFPVPALQWVCKCLTKPEVGDIMETRGPIMTVELTETIASGWPKRPFSLMMLSMVT